MATASTGGSEEEGNEKEEAKEEGNPLTIEATCENCQLPVKVHIDRFQVPEYRNWIKGTLCLQLTKEGLEPFVDTESKEIYDKIQPLLPPARACKTCTVKDYKMIERGKHNCSDCEPLIKELVKSSTNGRLNWTNLETLLRLTQQDDSHHDVAKVFMSDKVKDYTNPEKGDSTALLSFISGYKGCKSKIINTLLIEKVRESRNELMHTGTMCIDDGELHQHSQRCTTLLGDQGCQAYDECKQKIKEIEKILGKSLRIDILKTAEETAVQEHNKHINETILDIQHQIESPDCTKDVLESAKQKIKELEENETKLNVVMKIYDLKTTPVYDNKQKASEVYQQAEEKKEQLVTAKLNKELVEERQIRTNIEKELSQEKHNANKFKNDLEEEKNRKREKLTDIQNNLEAEKEKATKLKRELEDEKRIASQLKRDLEEEKQNRTKLKTELDTEKNATTKLKRDLDKKTDIINLEKQQQESMDRDKQRQTDYDTKRKALRRHLTDRYRSTCQCNPLHTAKPYLNIEKKDVYVRQNIKEVTNKAQTGDGRCKVENVFSSDGRKINDVYVRGKPGVGKTAYCKHLAYIWSDVNSYSDETKLSPEERELKQFENVFYVDLTGTRIDTDLKNIDDLVCLIQKQLDLEDYDVKEHISNEPSLILLDNMTEIKPLPSIRKQVHHGSTVLHCSTYLGKENDTAMLQTDTSKVIEINGLTKESNMKLAERTIRFLKEATPSEKKCKEFMQKMEDVDNKQFFELPMAFVQMVCLWFDDISLGKSQLDLFGNIVHNQLVSYAKVCGVVATFDAGNQPDFPLSCTDKNCACHHYSDLLWKLSKLAYRARLNETAELLFGFDDELLENCKLSKNELDICLNAGIIAMFTQTRAYIYHFPHLVYQDYFASVFLCKSTQHIDVQKEFATRKYTLDQVLEFSNVLMFCSELNIDVARQLNEVIIDIASEDLRVKVYRNSCDKKWNAPNADMIRRVQTVLLASRRHAPQLQLQLHDMRVHRHDIKELVETKQGIVKSLFVSSPADDEWRQILDPCTGLQKLVLNNCKMSADTIDKTVKANDQTLQALGLYGSGLDLKSLGSNWANIMSIRSLVSLGLGGITLSHDQIRLVFFQTVPILPQLREVHYRSLTCIKHGHIGEKCDSKLILSENPNLTAVSIWNLPASTVLFDPVNLEECHLRLDEVSAQLSALECLQNANKLHSLVCSGLNNPEMIHAFHRTLSNLKSLKKLVLQFVEFQDGTVVRTVQTPNGLEIVELHEFVIPGEWLHSLLDSLCATETQIGLYNGKVDGEVNVLYEIRDDKRKLLTDDEVHYEGGNLNVEKFIFFSKN